MHVQMYIFIKPFPFVQMQLSKLLSLKQQITTKLSHMNTEAEKAVRTTCTCVPNEVVICLCRTCVCVCVLCLLVEVCVLVDYL